MAGKSSSKLVIYGAIGANVAIAIAKFVATYFTGSSAMLSEGIHSLVDSGNGLLLLYGLHQSTKPASIEFPFGRSKELYFWSLIVAVLVFSVGGGMSIYEGIAHIKEPAPITDPTWNYWVLALGILFEGTSFLIAMREFNKSRGTVGWVASLRRSKDPSVFAILMEDFAALIGLVIALLGVYFGHALNNPYLDGAASICIGLLLVCVAIFLIRETKGLLIGEGVDRDTLNDLLQIARQRDTVDQVRPPLTSYLGPEDVILALDVQFRRDLNAVEIEQAIDDLQDDIREKYPEFKRIFIEAKSLGQKHRTTEISGSPQ
ncbi:MULTISPECIES: cation diffusion facilitator family transporter [Hymenobacter]|uniref:cation diffusion facilitator family transporter n=1 Tax=Hymenobacter TaxID=89966 RepID=UPI001624F65E|nr:MULTISPECIES: cation diffusion facilitator family transporter [Hymenobacter]QNE41021.1 cation diffusion facilitator family transporter [Hymenobacter sp. NBH84]